MNNDSPVKGLVLTGGRGTRLRPFTYTGAKQLIPIANKPVVFYAVEDLVAAGVTEIGIVTGDTAAQVEETLGDGSRFGARFNYIRQDAPRGITHAVLTARDFLRDSPFVLFLGDNLLRGGISAHLDCFRKSHPDAQIFLKPVLNPQDFGIAELDEADRPVRILEKPASPPTNLAVIGIYFFGPRFFEAAARIQPSPRGELEITDAIQELINLGGRVEATRLTEQWIDTGRPEDILVANRLFLHDLRVSVNDGFVENSKVEGKVVLQAGSRVIDSVLEGPIIIGERVTVEGSRIGPCTSIYEDSVVRSSNIEDSVVLERANLLDSGTLLGCLIGRDVTISGLSVPGGITLALGDSTRIEAR